MCLIYSADNPAHYHYVKALRHELAGLPEPLVKVAVVRETDHVFTPLEAQAQVLETVTAWAQGLRAGRSPS